MPDRRRGFSAFRDKLTGKSPGTAEDRREPDREKPAAREPAPAPAPVPEEPAAPAPAEFVSTDGSVRFVGDAVGPAPSTEEVAPPGAVLDDRLTVPDGLSNTVAVSEDAAPDGSSEPLAVREAAARDVEPRVLLPFLEQEALVTSPVVAPRDAGTLGGLVDGTSNTLAFGETVAPVGETPLPQPSPGATAPEPPPPVPDGTSNTLLIGETEDDDLPTVVLDDEVVEQAGGSRGEERGERGERGQARAAEAHEANEERRAARNDDDEPIGAPADEPTLLPPLLDDEEEAPAGPGDEDGGQDGDPDGGLAGEETFVADF